MKHLLKYVSAPAVFAAAFLFVSTPTAYANPDPGYDPCEGIWSMLSNSDARAAAMTPGTWKRYRAEVNFIYGLCYLHYNGIDNFCSVANMFAIGSSAGFTGATIIGRLTAIGYSVRTAAAVGGGWGAVVGGLVGTIGAFIC